MTTRNNSEPKESNNDTSDKKDDDNKKETITSPSPSCKKITYCDEKENKNGNSDSDSDSKLRESISNTNNTASSCETIEKCIATCAACGIVCKFVAQLAGLVSRQAINKLVRESMIFVDEPHFKHVNKEDIVIGKKLGEGGFCNVHPCSLKAKNKDSQQEFVVKSIMRKIMVNISSFKHGASDLHLKACIMGI